jgi:TPR repeat protein
MAQSKVTPNSIYGSQQLHNNDNTSPFGNMNFFQSNSDIESMTSSSDLPSKRPSTIIQPRMQHVEMPVKIEQVNGFYAQASHATIEPRHQQQLHHQVGDFMLQPAPSTSTNSFSTYNNNKSSRHPQPLPPLVIPPTPNRSVSNQSFASPQQRSPLPPSSSSQCQLTPSLTPGGTTPMTDSPRTPLSKQSPTTTDPRKMNGDALLLEGIKYHESGKLEQATYYFHKAAQQNIPMAMFFYGVSLRHGWGCQKNEPVAFQYIQKAAEHAVLDLNSLSTTVNTSASKGELIMAIYEMGVSFRHGWGCRKNKETAVYFFKIAADLGDADAQNDLGHCYYHGQGVKKDVGLAAKYYRKADKQGHGIMGNSWIWKKKYDPK